MAERSKAPVSGTGLFGGVGSNPTPISFGRCFANFFTRGPPFSGQPQKNPREQQKRTLPTMGLEPTILLLGGARLIH